MLNSLKIFAKNHSNQVNFRFAHGANQLRNVLLFNGTREQFRILTQAMEFIVEGTPSPYFSEGEVVVTDHDGVTWVLRRGASGVSVVAGGQPSTIQNLKTAFKEIFGSSDPKIGRYGVYFEDSLKQVLTRKLDRDHRLEAFDPLLSQFLRAIQNLCGHLKLVPSSSLLTKLLANRTRIHLIINRFDVLSDELTATQTLHEETDQDLISRRILEDGLREIELFNLIEIKSRRIEDLAKTESVWMKELDHGSLIHDESGARPQQSALLAAQIGKSSFDQAFLLVTKLKALTRLKAVLAELSRSVESGLEHVQKKLLTTEQRISTEIAYIQEKWEPLAESIGVEADISLESLVSRANQVLLEEVKQSKRQFAELALAEFQEEVSGLRTLIAEWRRLNQSQKTELPANLSLLLSEARGVRRYYQQRMVKVSKKLLETAQNSANKLVRQQLQIRLQTGLEAWTEMQKEMNIILPDLNSPERAVFINDLDRFYFLSATKGGLNVNELEELMSEKHVSEINFFQIQTYDAANGANNIEKWRNDIIERLSSSASENSVVVTMTDDQSTQSLLFKSGVGRCFVEIGAQRAQVEYSVQKPLSPRREKIQETLGILNYKKKESSREE